MAEQLLKIFTGKLAMLRQEEKFLRQASFFYQLGFQPGRLTGSQMAQVDGIMKTAKSLPEARENLRKFIHKQLEKLRDKEERDGKVSWLLEPQISDTPADIKDSLGETLLLWIDKQKYLEARPPDEKPPSGPPDPLAAMRQFWGNVYGLFKYEATCGNPMPLNVGGTP
ncbi:MAG: hypothetical protein KKC76_14065 [Proteobacteria bacterium]|nr:hypothetical protein [Pseudomonadota bacterium]MBU4298307.1 hypothetical protein [Pseudomonadota bacterium]MCG2749693.1 hypothetical protein [Desulfobulbaceae bacterium]